MSIRRIKKFYGFTLLELLTTIAVSAIVLSIGVPNLSGMMKNARLTEYINHFAGALYVARSEAAKRNQRVTVCKSANASVCAAAGGWDQGWIVFTDPNNNATVDIGEEILQVYEALPVGMVMTGNANVDDYISYVSTGESKRTTGAFQNGTVSLCDDRTGNHGKNLILNNAGRVRVETEKPCP